MTREQKTWLDAHKPYKVMTRVGGDSYYTGVGMLHADGTFELKKANRRPNVMTGSFEVGVLEARSSDSMQGPITR